MLIINSFNTIVNFFFNFKLYFFMSILMHFGFIWYARIFLTQMRIENRMEGQKKNNQS